MYNSQYNKQPIKRKSAQVYNNARRTFSPPNTRTNFLSVQNPSNKQLRLLRYTFSSNNLKKFDCGEDLINSHNIQDLKNNKNNQNDNNERYIITINQKRNSFQSLKNAVLELQNKINRVNSDFFNKQKNIANTVTTNLVKNKTKPIGGFKDLHIKSKAQTIRPMSQTQIKSLDPQHKYNFSQITCETSSTIQTNSFKPLFGANNSHMINMNHNSNNKPVTKISQYITSQPMPENFYLIHNNNINNNNNNSKINLNLFANQGKNLYYLNQIHRASNQKNSLALQHINSSIKMIKCCILQKQKFKHNHSNHYNKHQPTSINIPYEIYNSIQFKSMFKMQRLQKNWNKKTLILDLDQTLIHCYQQLQIQTDMKLNIDIQGQKIQIGVNIRPYALSFLKRMAKKFQIVIFTASHQSYANVILDQLDPENQIFSHRFYRQHCIVLSNGLHIKDLSYVPRDIKNVVLVDNAAYSYAFQLLNGIPIFPYYQGKDYQLIGLQKYLQKLLQTDDVRQMNKKYFKLNEYAEFQSAQELISQIYSNPERRYCGYN